MNKSSIFLLNKSKGRYSFDMPEAVYVDTCFWNEAFGVSSDKLSRQECDDFLSYCTSNNIRLYVSGIVYDEIQHIIKISITDNEINNLKINKNKYRYNDGSINYKKLYEYICSKNPKVLDDINSEISRMLGLIDEMAFLLDYECDMDFNYEVIRLYKDFNYLIGISDLKHALICHLYSLNCIATRDGDYWVFDNMNIYTPNNEKYRIEMLDRRNVYLGLA